MRREHEANEWLERAREGGANVRIFVHNGIVYLTPLPSQRFDQVGLCKLRALVPAQRL